MALPVEFADVLAARERIAGRVHRTPVLTSATLDRELGAQLFVKAENLQKVGAFKARGACNAVMALPDDAVARGVVTHSSGNHAGALAWAAAQRGAPCAVVMPETAPRVKVDAVRGYGAEVVFCKPAEREQVCARVQQERGAVMVHPFENLHVIAGQGTAALELFEDVPELDVVIAPVGGGGLLAGTAIVARAVRPACAVYGAEPLAVDDAARSLASGVRQPRVENPKTWADGLLTALGEPNFALLRHHRVLVQTVDEAALLAAARFFLERMKVVVEPSGATVLAAARALGGALAGKRVGLIVSGGNTDFAWLAARS
jgi:threonine dehydratase